MTQKELETQIMQTIEDYYEAQDDAEIHLARELDMLENNYELGHIDEETYQEEEDRLVSEINQANNHAAYCYNWLEQYFVDYQDMTGEKVNLEYFTEGGIFS